MRGDQKECPLLSGLHKLACPWDILSLGFWLNLRQTLSSTAWDRYGKQLETTAPFGYNRTVMRRYVRRQWQLSVSKPAFCLSPHASPQSLLFSCAWTVPTPVVMMGDFLSVRSPSLLVPMEQFVPLLFHYLHCFFTHAHFSMRAHTHVRWWVCGPLQQPFGSFQKVCFLHPRFPQISVFCNISDSTTAHLRQHLAASSYDMLVSGMLWSGPGLEEIDEKSERGRENNGEVMI